MSHNPASFRGLFDVFDLRVVDRRGHTLCRFRICCGYGCRLGEVLVAWLFTAAEQHHMRARHALYMQPDVFLGCKFEGDIFVLYVVLPQSTSNPPDVRKRSEFWRRRLLRDMVFSSLRHSRLKQFPPDFCKLGFAARSGQRVGHARYIFKLLPRKSNLLGQRGFCRFCLCIFFCSIFAHSAPV